jgi:type I restriction enzyme M protein
VIGVEPIGKRGYVAKGKNKSVTGTSGISELLNELWQAAVTLRGAIEPADYKRYVLPIIFLRFLSLRYEKRRAELESLIADPKSDHYKHKRSLDDPDEYRAGGAFIVPEPARWANILKMAPADDVKIKLDAILKLLEDTYPDRLRGLLPPIYAGSNMTAEHLRELINLFSKEIFTYKHGGEDLIGRVYEYFIGEFANSEGKRGGEYFTPSSIVKLLVAMLNPIEGAVFDPCCGSGGMFVQSDAFTHHSHRLSFFGQESKDFTHRLCRMNLFIHGIDGDIRLGNSYTNDQFAGRQFEYVIANPPFNDGSKGENGWGASGIPGDDPRLKIDGETLPLSPRNANTMWMRHFLYHLKEGGTAGFVMATGELSNAEIARLAVRKALLFGGYVDCIVTLTGQLFANTQIPCALWFMSKNRKGQNGYRKRQDEILFVNARRLGTLIPGSRKQKRLSDTEIQRISDLYHEFRRTADSPQVPGFSKVVKIDETAVHGYALTPGRYVGTADTDASDGEFAEVFPALIERLKASLQESEQAAARVRDTLRHIVYSSGKK